MKSLLNTVLSYVIVAILAVIIFYLLTKPVEHVKTTIDIEKIIDSIKKTIIIPNPINKTIYIDSFIYLKKEVILKKRKDSIIIKIDSIKIPVAANIYKTELIADNAIAHLSIYTSGELFKVEGVIHHNKEKKLVETFKYINRNSLYLYTGISIIDNKNKKIEVGTAYTFKNKYLLAVSFDHIPNSNKTFLNVKFGISLSKK